MTKVLIIGASGMLGSAVMQILSLPSYNFEVRGTVRSSAMLKHFSPHNRHKLFCGVDANDADSIVSALSTFRPDIVINCAGVVKQLEQSKNPLFVLPVNSLFPHRLQTYCSLLGARLIQISTDCVFSGAKGRYCETDPPDAGDLYGMSKCLGEVTSGNAVTLRTSIIGHEFDGARSLVDWFLAQTSKVKGYREAYFSGLPTYELARIIAEKVIPRNDLIGLYHVASTRICKYDLLKLIAKIYSHDIEIVPDSTVRIDRSLNASRFESLTGYRCSNWEELISQMHSFRAMRDIDIL